MTPATALPPYNIAPATNDDMPFIRDAVARLRLGGERLEAGQVLVLRRAGGGGVRAPARRIEQRPTLADVYRAKPAIEPYLQRTPLVHNPYLSRLMGCEAYLKLENLQPIGAFKVRGGVNLAALLPEE